MQSQVNRMRGCPPQPARARPVVDHAKPCPGRCQRAARRQHKICAQIDINNLPSPLSSFDDSNSLGTIGCADGSTSPASPVKTGVVAQLLRGPSRDHSLITAHPRMRQLQHALRGGRTEFRGLEKPVLLTFLPAYMWGAVGTLVGELLARGRPAAPSRVIASRPTDICLAVRNIKAGMTWTGSQGAALLPGRCCVSVTSWHMCDHGERSHARMPCTSFTSSFCTSRCPCMLLTRFSTAHTTPD